MAVSRLPVSLITSQCYQVNMWTLYCYYVNILLITAKPFYQHHNKVEVTTVYHQTKAAPDFIPSTPYGNQPHHTGPRKPHAKTQLKTEQNTAVHRH